MKRVAIRLGGGLLVVILAVLGGALFILSRFDARAEIERQVEAATGRDMQIAGDVSVSFYPVLGFRAADVSLANAPGGKATHFLKSKNLAVGVGTRAALNRKIEVHELVFIEPQLNLEVDANGQPNWVFMPAAPPRPADPNAKPAPAPDLKLDGMSIKRGRVAYANVKTNTAYALDDIDLSLAVDSLDQPVTTKGKATYAGAPLSFEATLGKPRALLNAAATPLKFTLGSKQVEASFDGALDAKTGALDGAVKASGPSLRGLAAWAGSPIGEGPGLEAFTVDGRLALGDKSTSFSNASVTLDQIVGRGDFLVETSAKVPLISGRLELTQALDLNPYLAAKSAAPGAAPTVTIEAVNVAAPGWSTATMDLSGLKAINANLELTTQAITVQKMKLDRAKLSFVLASGRLVATLSEMALYGGAGTGQFAFDASQPTLGVTQKLDVKGLQAAAFLTDAIGFAQLDGAANLSLDLTGNGASQDALMRSLNGQVNLSLANGGLEGVDLGGLSRTIGKAMDGKLISADARTGFSTFNANFRLVDGVAATRGLKIKMEGAEIGAIGVIDVGGRKLDMRLTPKVDSVLARIGGPFKGASVTFPFHVAGGWDKLSYKYSTDREVRAAVEARARAVLDAQIKPRP
jgi:AsmA protein